LHLRRVLSSLFARIEFVTVDVDDRHTEITDLAYDTMESRLIDDLSA
jgi:hypothetical protein